MTEEEKAAKLREMQSNANWRDEERSRNVKRYRDEDKLEKDTHKDKFDSSFIKYATINLLGYVINYC